jgi:hypothetical protein
MPQKPTGIANIAIDSAGIATLRTEGAPAWEAAVLAILNNLNNKPPNHTSRYVLNALSRSGRKTVIVPIAASARNASAGPDHWPAATTAGGHILHCADNPTTPANETGTQVVGYLPGAGTGTGSDIVLRYAAQDWVNTAGLPGGRPEEVLLHEMIHGLRQQRGVMQCTALPTLPNQTYDTVEELFAILVTNIYRSECGYLMLRADHHGLKQLEPPLDLDEKFYAKWKLPIDMLVKEMPDLCTHLAVVKSMFNPLRFALRQKYSQKEIVERHNQLLAPLTPTVIREAPF